MKAIFRKYWFISIQFILFLLLLLYSYNQKDYYLETDNKQIGKNVFIITFSLLACLVVVLLTIWIRDGIKLKRIATNLVNTIIVSVSFYFLLSTILLSGTYFINRLLVRDIVNKNYTVVDVHPETRRITLYDFLSHSILWNKQLMINRNLQNLSERDTVKVSFKKGLFGFYFDPTLN